MVCQVGLRKNRKEEVVDYLGVRNEERGRVTFYNE